MVKINIFSEENWSKTHKFILGFHLFNVFAWYAFFSRLLKTSANTLKSRVTVARLSVVKDFLPQTGQKVILIVSNGLIHV